MSERLVIDFETRSAIPVELQKCGPWKYAQHETTQIVCMAVKNEEVEGIWVNEKIVPESVVVNLELLGYRVFGDSEIEYLVRDAEVLEAHNAEFERAIIDAHFKRMPNGWMNWSHPNLWRCSAALAASRGLPRSLSKAAEALGLSEQKDSEGHKAMMKMTKPRKPTKNNPSKWVNDEETFTKVCTYCVQDVRTEWAISERLGQLQKKEQEIWKLDQVINHRGIPVDVDSANIFIQALEVFSTNLNKELYRLTNGEVNTGSQIKALTEHLAKHFDLKLDSLSKDYLAEDAVQKMIEKAPSQAKRILGIRELLSKASVKKFTAFTQRAQEDNRCRSCFMYHGAITGRWSGKAIQPQNMQRDSFDHVEYDRFVPKAEAYAMGIDLFEEGHNVAADAGRCVRGTIAAQGKDQYLIAADLKSIENIGLAWLAQESYVLNAFDKGLDNYKVTASKIYGVRYEDVNKEQRLIGKVTELACGYQGWIGAFHTMGRAYGVTLSDERAAEIAGSWRESRPKTVAFWAKVQRAAILAVRNPGTKSTVNRVTFFFRGEFLYCVLPSGRSLFYHKPKIVAKPDPYTGEPKPTLSYMGVDSYTNKYTRLFTYGGKLTENITQAVCRDILAEAALRIDPKYPIVLHVHDEIVSEITVPRGTKREFEVYEFPKFLELMCQRPEWAQDMPIKADGWWGKRYRKD